MNAASRRQRREAARWGLDGGLAAAVAHLCCVCQLAAVCGEVAVHEAAPERGGASMSNLQRHVCLVHRSSSTETLSQTTVGLTHHMLTCKVIS